MTDRAFSCICLFISFCAAANAATCSVAGSAGFGAYNPLAGQAATTPGTVAVTCTGTIGELVSYTVALTAGLGSYADRTMLYGTAVMHYNLYKDSGCTQIWGDGTSSTSQVDDSYSLTSTSVTKYYTVYSRIWGDQRRLRGGSYADDVIVTVTY